MDAINANKKEVIMERKTNNPSWCIERIQEKIEDYKASVRETTDSDVRRQLEIIIDDLEDILYKWDVIYLDVSDTLDLSLNTIKTHDFILTDGELLKWSQFLLAKGCDHRLKDNPYIEE